jgi:hypothetical protein
VLRLRRPCRRVVKRCRSCSRLVPSFLRLVRFVYNGQTPLYEQVGQQVGNFLANKFVSGAPDTNLLYNFTVTERGGISHLKGWNKITTLKVEKSTICTWWNNSTYGRGGKYHLTGGKSHLKKGGKIHLKGGYFHLERGRKVHLTGCTFHLKNGRKFHLYGQILMDGME